MIFKKFFEKIFLLKRVYFYLFLLFLSIVIFFIGILIIKLSISGDDGLGSIFVAFAFIIFLSSVIFIINVIFISIYESKNKTKNPLIMIIYLILIVFLISYGIFGDPFFLKYFSDKYEIHPEKYLRNQKIDNFIQNNNIEGCLLYVDKLNIKIRQPYDDPELIEEQFKLKCKEEIAFNLKDLSYCKYDDTLVSQCNENVLRRIELNESSLDKNLDRDRMLLLCESLDELENKDSNYVFDRNYCVNKYKYSKIILGKLEIIDNKKIIYLYADFPDKKITEISKEFTKDIITENITEIKHDLFMLKKNILDTNTLFFEVREVYLDLDISDEVILKTYVIGINKLDSKIIELEDIFFDVNKSLTKVSMIKNIELYSEKCPLFYFDKENITFLCDSPDYNISVSFNDFSTSDVNFEKLNSFFP